MNDDKKVSIILITGFLGSGKTTFLNYLIHSLQDLKISLILNEFGSVKLETEFIKEKGVGEIAELSNGCMCCVAKSDIPHVIDYIVEKSPETNYILIEASGLSDPDPIRQTLQSLNRSDCKYDYTLCVVDSLNFESSLNTNPIILSQIGDSDLVLLSKTKEAGEKRVNDVKSKVENLGTGIKTILWDENLYPQIFLDVYIVNHLGGVKEHNHYHNMYADYIYTTDKEIEITKLQVFYKSLSMGIIRSKGYFFSNSKKYLLQYIGTKLEIEQVENDGKSTKSNILFVGLIDDIEKLKETPFF